MSQIYQTLIILIILIILLTLLYWLSPYNIIGFDQSYGKYNNENLPYPVSDPAFYMRQIIKHSIILEDYLTQKPPLQNDDQPKINRCQDCIIEQFNHIFAFHEKALWIANENCHKYPMLIETTEFYSDQYDDWINAYDDDETLYIIATKLKNVRLKLEDIYFNNNYCPNTNSKEKFIKNYKDNLDDIPIPKAIDNPRPPLDDININSYGRIY